MGWLHIVSDVMIAVSYVAIPCVLCWFAWRRNWLPFKGVILLFAAFILCCGMTHLMEAVVFWWPAYGLAGVLKAVTAVVSGATVLALLPVIPRALAMRSPTDLEREVRQRTAELENARAMAALMVEASPAGVVVVDGDGVVVQVNAVTEQLFGYSRQEIIGNKVEMLVPARFTSQHSGQRESFMRSPEPRQMGLGRDVFARHADGREIPVEIGLSAFESQGRRFVLAAVVDVSERARLQREADENSRRVAAANEALQRSNEELEQFAFVASHDLQEPLRKISSFCQLLQEEQGERLGEDGREYLGIAIHGAERLKTLVRDLLDFSRITTRGKPLRAVDPIVSLEAAISDLELQIKEAGATVTYDEGLPLVIADSTQLRTVFQNLIGNALKYQGDHAPEVHVGASSQGSFVRLSVSDNGIGIAREHFDRIFKIFQRLHNQREYAGNGIGLAHCKKIVERFGGRIWLESTPGEGTTFYLEFHAAEPLEVAHDADERALVAPAG